MVDDLEISLCRMVGIDAGGAAACTKGTETPLMFNWATSEAVWLPHRTLTRGAAALAEAQHVPVLYDSGSIALARPWGHGRPRRG